MSQIHRLATGFVLAASIATSAVAAPQDWSKVTNRTPAGAFVQGNPDARVNLVEYLSLTCPHCAKLEGEAILPLTAKYIRTGQVSYEVRHALRDGFDFAASMVARCDGPQSFFAVAPLLYGQQQAWMGRAATWSQSAEAPKEQLPPDRLLPLLAVGAGFDQVLAARGYTQAKVRACTVNPAEQKVLIAQADEAWKRPNFPGTPTFLINGTMTPGITSWADLDRALSAALK
ncbi:thioredoxin domain-containing protein [uncultured Sphingomonas sp.]|uniref:thioredoxin domain-containing protein n=1 Tax=uncultured Sphingomonas sp. TaxID=158754 RepID=UPI0025D54A28|nr:thioredoxin domain-containing protein [uncultured Sphingomonas sp.]